MYPGLVLWKAKGEVVLYCAAADMCGKYKIAHRGSDNRASVCLMYIILKVNAQLMPYG